jgi:hypothetical protein
MHCVYRLSAALSKSQCVPHQSMFYSVHRILRDTGAALEQQQCDRPGVVQQSQLILYLLT